MAAPRVVALLRIFSPGYEEQTLAELVPQALGSLQQGALCGVGATYVALVCLDQGDLVELLLRLLPR